MEFLRARREQRHALIISDPKPVESVDDIWAGAAQMAVIGIFVLLLGACHASPEESIDVEIHLPEMVQADLFDCELNAARELLKQGFARGAGAIAGVVLEKHLDQVAANHNISVRKKNPAISDYNDLLKNNKVFDVPTWRQIQRFGTIRNLCDRNKGAEPTPQEVEELVSGVEKVTKSIF